MPSKIILDEKVSVKEPPQDSVEPQSTPQARQGLPPELLQRPPRTRQPLSPGAVLQLQRAIGNRAVGRWLNRNAQNTRQSLQREPLPESENKTGLPDQLKSGVETLSGLALDDVRVHYNSSKPAQLNALAYTQGAEIHIGPGQEKHLPHEAWHVAQQKQGRVKPTWQAKGVAINDNAVLEEEAEVMGNKAVAGKSTEVSNAGRPPPDLGRPGASLSPATTTIQRVFSAIDENGFLRFQWIPPATPSSSASPSSPEAPSKELYVQIMTEKGNKYFIRVSDLKRGAQSFVDEEHKEAKPEISLEVAFEVARSRLEQRFITKQAAPKRGNPLGRYAEDRTVLIVVRSREVFKQIATAQATGQLSEQANVITLPQVRDFPPQIKLVTTYYLQGISPTEEYAVYEPTPLRSLTPTAEPPPIGQESKKKPIEHPLAIVPYGPTYDSAISVGRKDLDRFASTNPRSRNQGELMGASANAVAKKMGLPEDAQAPHYGYEWLHLRSYSLVGKGRAQEKYNLVLGTWRVNTQMITVEEYVRELITKEIASAVAIDVDATAIPGKPLWFSREITYSLTIKIGSRELQRELTFDPLSFRRPAYIERELDRFLIPLIYKHARIRKRGRDKAAPDDGQEPEKKPTDNEMDVRDTEKQKSQASPERPTKRGRTSGSKRGRRASGRGRGRGRGGQGRTSGRGRKKASESLSDVETKTLLASSSDSNASLPSHVQAAIRAAVLTYKKYVKKRFREGASESGISDLLISAAAAATKIYMKLIDIGDGPDEQWDEDLEAALNAVEEELRSTWA
jgi:hypothetical protein